MKRSASDSSLSTLSTPVQSPQLLATSPVSAVSGTAKSGFKIPGLGVVVNLPFSGHTMGTPKPSRMSPMRDEDSDDEKIRRKSFDSISTVLSEGEGTFERPVLCARESSGVIDPYSEERETPSRVKRSKKSRPRSQIVLGGKYLDEKEVRRNRRHSSIDSH